MEVLSEAIGMSLRAFAHAQYEQDIAVSRQHLDDQTFTKAWAEGHSTAMEQAIAYALEEQGG